ncbi:MAG: rhodanese-like domain-containing protein, partial [Chitinophagaceae bacterium]|nr:rhodanese-like domain-containing protein [Chitinophagaceae bacterium]
MENISVQDVKARLQAGEKLNFVDVREPDENAAFNIGGILLPLGKIHGMQFDDIEDMKNDELILYCRSGNRSLQGAMFLEMAGFK